LDQRTYREIRVGQIDTHVTAQNVAILHNRHHRRDEGESTTHQQDQLISSDDSLRFLSENDETSISRDNDEALSISRDNDEALSIQKSIVSSSVCKISDRCHVSL